jgi:hypothetical protein
MRASNKYYEIKCSMQNSINSYSNAAIIKQVKEHLNEFVVLQGLLLALFKAKYHQAKDWENLLDFPRRGDIDVDNTKWTFYLHGCGLLFKSQEGIIIDAHDYVDNPEVIDAWRIFQYLESMGLVAEGEVNFKDIKTALSELASQGFLKIVSNNKEKYKLF